MCHRQTKLPRRLRECPPGPFRRAAGADRFSTDESYGVLRISEGE
jgi:hypothetical protein